MARDRKPVDRHSTAGRIALDRAAGRIQAVLHLQRLAGNAVTGGLLARAAQARRRPPVPTVGASRPGVQVQRIGALGAVTIVETFRSDRHMLSADNWRTGDHRANFAMVMGR